ncbi:MAG: hypothetical protein H5T42_06335 [Methanothrix sp.]|uniref:hypothetical protein n=1 Tax=Methanothrix TaxID=2222 RepID=UPI000AC99796|nr:MULTISPECIES: hypothetical protein [Methanothrix]MBC7080069.1 hypothetical protein [Methanothrix sp.]NPU88318.1 hypothetical protein [Methanothrix sp.]
MDEGIKRFPHRNGLNVFDHAAEDLRTQKLFEIESKFSLLPELQNKIEAGKIGLFISQ